MTQPKIKQLVKLLEEYSREYAPDPNRAHGGVQDESQPAYREVVDLVRRQVMRFID